MDFFFLSLNVLRTGFILKALNGNRFVFFVKPDVSAEPDTGVKAEGVCCTTALLIFVFRR